MWGMENEAGKVVIVCKMKRMDGIVFMTRHSPHILKKKLEYPGLRWPQYIGNPR